MKPKFNWDTSLSVLSVMFHYTEATERSPVDVRADVSRVFPLLTCYCVAFLSTTNKMQRYTVFFIVVSALHVSSGFSAHDQELKNCTCSIGYLSNLFAATANVNESDLSTLAVAANKFDKYPLLHVQFLSSWWWAEKTLETCRALTTIKNTV